MPIVLKTLNAAVQGATYTRNLQCVNVDGSVPTAANPGPFLSSDTLSATVSPGQNLPSLFVPVVTWWSAPLTQVTLTISQAQTAMMSIDDQYIVNIFGTRSGVTYALGAFYLPVLPAAGSQVAAAPPDLITIPYAAQMLAKLALDTPQLEQVPTLITACSAAIRIWCHRTFTQNTYVETCRVFLSGYARLREVPINYITRIQSNPQVALTVTNRSPSVQAARAYASTTGDETNLAITGLTLAWSEAGVQQDYPITFSPNQTIAMTASAVNVVGSGWTAYADSVLGSWPATELMDTLIAKGAGQTDSPDGGAEFHVLGTNITGARFHPENGARTGMVWVDRQYGGMGPKWGPGWEQDTPSSDSYGGAVRITYNGGFASIPAAVQLATVELISTCLSRLKTDMILESEDADRYSYKLALQNIHFLPAHVRENLSLYRTANA